MLVNTKILFQQVLEAQELRPIMKNNWDAFLSPNLGSKVAISAKANGQTNKAIMWMDERWLFSVILVVKEAKLVFEFKINDHGSRGAVVHVCKQLKMKR